MSSPSNRPNAKLIIALMYDKLPSKLIPKMEVTFGKIESKSSELDFNYTSYYEKEFGKSLKKIYLSFESKFDMQRLPEAKKECFELEKHYSIDGKRKVNIDPGYVTKTSVVLASFKERAHRIYLKDGVYADLELVYQNNEWLPFTWTFPDIKDDKLKEFLNSVKSRIE